MVLGFEARLEARRGHRVVNNFQTGTQLLAEAELDCERAQQECKRGQWNRVVRASQEAVGHGLKGLLKTIGIEYPKVHDVSDVFERACKDKGLGIEEGLLREIGEISTSLADERSPAFYMERLYGQEEAEIAMAGAEKVLFEARKLAKKLQRE